LGQHSHKPEETEAEESAGKRVPIEKAAKQGGLKTFLDKVGTEGVIEQKKSQNQF